MILELIQPDASAWDAATVLVRAGYYAASLGAAGLALFHAGFAHRLAATEETRLRRLAVTAAGLAAGLSVLALVVRAGVLAGGGPLFEARIWQAMMTSRIGDAFWIRLGGLALIATLATRWRIASPLAVAGALAVAASYAAMGHSMLYRPRQANAALVVLHLLAVAFWAGSLLPLARVAARGGTEAASLIAAWSRIARWVVAVLVLAGVALAVLMVRRADLLYATFYGWALTVKVALVAAMLALALRHALVLAPAAARGEVGAGGRLAASIRAEAVVALLVFWAAAEMVSIHPLDAGHRVAS
jgi:putative copper export protein